MQAYLHFIWWGPPENWELNKGKDGRHQTEEVRGKHGRTYLWWSPWWPCMMMVCLIKAEAAVGLMAVVPQCVNGPFLCCCKIQYITSKTVEIRTREWMWLDSNDTVTSWQSPHRLLPCVLGSASPSHASYPGLGCGLGETCSRPSPDIARTNAQTSQNYNFFICDMLVSHNNYDNLGSCLCRFSII